MRCGMYKICHYMNNDIAKERMFSILWKHPGNNELIIEVCQKYRPLFVQLLFSNWTTGDFTKTKKQGLTIYLFRSFSKTITLASCQVSHSF